MSFYYNKIGKLDRPLAVNVGHTLDPGLKTFAQLTDMIPNHFESKPK